VALTTEVEGENFANKHGTREKNTKSMQLSFARDVAQPTFSGHKAYHSSGLFGNAQLWIRGPVILENGESREKNSRKMEKIDSPSESNSVFLGESALA